MSKNLKELDSHFAFGENWQKYANLIDEDRIQTAENSISSLLENLPGGANKLAGKTFLDIGCGSGLFSLAAARLGAKSITAIDIDPISVETTKAVFKRFLPNVNLDVRQLSVFDLKPDVLGKFDVVYSWGVLHHTGDLYSAIRKAAEMMNDNGALVLALYRSTKCDKAWKIIKRTYSSMPSILQKMAQFIYVIGFSIDLTINGTNPISYVKNYKKQSRGMSFAYDAHDWLGGYPYETISLQEMKRLADELNLVIQHKRHIDDQVPIGFFGSGCGEFALTRR
ncbi:MAG: class I SAM-dependent methyltransferase [Holosporales bacterium]|jgi:2-polyprenyl-6-hydroxyphenyl methylase/3-demethylubiquinone-9 3-methyltransferase|nr:class I SAM-dependent methyltransferase [Holosporales bacterium]